MDKLFEEKLKRLADDPHLLQALGALFNEKVEEFRPLVDKTDDDELLGQRFRAYEKAKELLKEVMKTIISYKDTQETNQDFNKSL
jgi:hypothetical protein